MKHFKKIRAALFGVVGLSGAVLVAACGESPTGAEGPPPQPTLNAFFSTAPGPGMDVLGRTKTLEEDQSETKLVKNHSGEWLDVGNAGIKVYIPPGALGDDPDLEMEITLFAPAGDRVVWEFAPHGLQFSEPLEIWIKTDDTEASFLKDQNTPSGLLDDFLGVYWKPGIGGNEVLETFPVYYDDGAYLIFETDHFSGYAIAM